jgi:hypothetical protein
MHIQDQYRNLKSMRSHRQVTAIIDGLAITKRFSIISNVALNRSYQFCIHPEFRR